MGRYGAVWGLVIFVGCAAADRDTPITTGDSAATVGLPAPGAAPSGRDGGVPSSPAQPAPPSDAPSGDPNVCAEQDFAIEPAPVRVMILQDMSASMDGERWEQARDAMNTLLSGWRGRGIQFGFDRFSNPRGCDVTAPVVYDTQLDNENAIMAALSTMEPGGSTPLLCGMRNFTNPAYAPSFVDSSQGSSYLLVISDGGDYCGTQCVAGSGVLDPVLPHLGPLTAELLDNFGIKTHAIGFGDGFDSDELEAIVRAGGTGRQTFFDAADGPALQSVFEEIAQSVVSCVYELGETPSASRDDVNFYFDGDPVGLDQGCANGAGWRWSDGSQQKVEFCPGACARLQQGVSTISATFGCPTQVII